MDEKARTAADAASTGYPPPDPASLVSPDFEVPVPSVVHPFAPPVYGRPSYDAEAFAPPTYQPPTYEPPTYEPATFEPPTHEAPTYEAPTHEPVDPTAPDAQGAAHHSVTPTAAPSTGRGVGRLVAIGLVCGLVGGAIGGIGAYTVAEKRAQGSVTSPGTVLPQSDADLSARPSGSIAAVAAAVLPTVVQIEERGATGAATGSGFVVRQDGYILTNNHVVASAANGGSIDVTFQDGTTRAATIVGRDPSYDLAVIKVDATALPTATLGNSDGVVVGDSVIAIGSPLGLEGTVTTGIVSSLNRPVTAGGSGESSYINAIQTDAAINPGNSGGPLVDAQGKVIGVNSAIASLSGSPDTQPGSIGLGFAIPVNQAKRVADEIISTGKSTHPVIGVSVDVRFGGPGAQVKNVTIGGGAASAGIKAGDVITTIDGRVINDATELIVAVRTHAPGDTVTVGVKDGSATRDVQVKLGADSTTG
jgi:putative serine protease PepD